MSEHRPEGRLFLEATRTLDEPTDVDRERIRAKTLAAIAASGATAATATRAAASTSHAAASSSGWFGGAVTGALLAVAVLGVATIVETVLDRGSSRGVTTRGAVSATPTVEIAAAPSPSEPRRPARDVQRVAAGASAEGSPSTRAPVASKPEASAAAVDPPEGSAAAGAPAAPAVPPTARGIDEELAVLRQAQEALRAGKPDEAVRALDRFGSAHAGGALEEERLAARIVAACATESPEARAEASRFLRERPASPLRDRVESACLAKAPR